MAAIEAPAASAEPPLAAANSCPCCARTAMVKLSTASPTSTSEPLSVIAIRVGVSSTPDPDVAFATDGVSSTTAMSKLPEFFAGPGVFALSFRMT